jgi:hypothetical protein
MEKPKKSLNLPKPLAAYFAADKGDSETTRHSPSVSLKMQS